MPDLTITVGCYGQPKMMKIQEEAWLSWPIDILNRIEIIVVDDHGTPPYEPSEETLELPLSVYRVKDNIPWNQMGARNLAMKQAKADWRLMLDTDMVLQGTQICRIMDLLPQLREGNHYKPKLTGVRDPYGSPNLYLVHRNDFWRAGGYNEDFAGHKGFSDCVLHNTLEQTTKRHYLDSISVRYYKNTEVPDADVQTLNRDLAVNRKKYEAATRAARTYGGWRKYASAIKNHVRFNWDRVR